ncbi:MAG: HAD family hydrolase [Snowella sp.]|nr:HAD family hydrolase [Snowella sp.]
MLKLTRQQFLTLALGTTLTTVALRKEHQVIAAPSSPAIEPLPSWQAGKVKTKILAFVERVTTPNHPDFVPVENRIAVFDNDGTLWAEQPYVQLIFLQNQLQKLVKTQPEIAEKQPYKAALAGNTAYFAQAGEKTIMEIIMATSANRTDGQFRAEVEAFFQTAKHPTLGFEMTRVVYQPMLELLAYLRSQGFQTWICSGGGIDFMRIISQAFYGIPPQQVIGSSLKKEFRLQSGKGVIWRLPEIGTINDKETKPVNIALHIGKHPIVAVGNVKSGGDIAMLRYSQAQSPSLQLLVNHDDDGREFAYQEKDQASLTAAKENDWSVISMKQDWKQIFKT